MGSVQDAFSDLEGLRRFVLRPTVCTMLLSGFAGKAHALQALLVVVDECIQSMRGLREGSMAGDEAELIRCSWLNQAVHISRSSHRLL